MLRNYLIVALRNMVRNRLTAFIGIGGLSMAFATAFLIALFVHDELTYDRWIPDQDRIVRLSSIATFPHAAEELETVPPSVAAMLRETVAEVEATARFTGSFPTIGQGDIEAQEKVYWADVNLFDVLKLPFVAGDRNVALLEPGSVVLTQTMARKYFGTENVIGRTLTFNRKTPMKVTGVLEDLPSNTHLDFRVVAAGTSQGSSLAVYDSRPPSPAELPPMGYLYARLRSVDSLQALRDALPPIVEQHPEFRYGGTSITLYADKISSIHLQPVGSLPSAMKDRGNIAAAYGFILIGALIVAVAVINFVGIASAIATKRAPEIGVRKLSGAERRHLLWQFVAENMLHVTGAMIVALVLAWSALPAFNGLLQRTIVFPTHLAWGVGLIATVTVISFAAGSYPALLLARLRPARILKNERTQGAKARLRSVLISIQFAVLIGLGLMSTVVYTQLRYALEEGLRFEQDLVLQIATPCTTGFAMEARKIPGVIGGACANGPILGNGFPAQSIGPNGYELSASISMVDFGYFELFGLKPVAGRFFSPSFGSDSAPVARDSTAQPAIVVNEAFARSMGFATPEQAVGQIIRWSRQANPAQWRPVDPRPSEIIGVVPDFARGSVREETPPTIFWVDPIMHRLLNLKLDGARVPETLAAIDGLWRRVGDPRAISRTFVDQAAQALYLDLARQSQVLGHLTLIAVLIAALGLFGLAAFTAEQRTKEIGIRKSMGASSGDILRLMLWQFARPVLWANLIAWPVAYIAMRQWLDGFAYRIELAPWMFVAATAAALAIALLTVIGHALLVARAHPVSALRYE